MARPFDVKVVPPPPLTVDETAQEYGVSRAKSKVLKNFAAGVVLRVPAGTKSGKTRIIVFRPSQSAATVSRRLGTSGARKSAKRPGSVSPKKK